MANQEKDKYTKWMVIAAIAVVILTWFAGFFIGRKTVKDPKPTIVTEYIKGDDVHDTIVRPEPYSVVMPFDTADVIKQCVRDGIYAELFPVRIITKYVEVTRDDTTTIMRDWAAKRTYKETLFESDTVGSCDVTVEVQYNRVRGIGYNYKPIYKTVTITRYDVKAFSPFLGIGLSGGPYSTSMDLGGNIMAGSFFKEKVGAYVQYTRMMGSKRDIFSLGALYKF